MSDPAPAPPACTDDLALAQRLADAADAVSTAHFRSEELRTVTKDDGTPVSAVDLAVEQAMQALVAAERPGDAFRGEEVGAHPGTTGRRWIVDGIDGTHNYAAGRAGWGTIITLEAEGHIVVGLVTSPRHPEGSGAEPGRRWWAVRDQGAFTAATVGGAPEPMRCRPTPGGGLAGADVIVIPFEGFLLGWRNQVARRFTPPAEPRSQCFALDAVQVAWGRLDATVCIFGSEWDYAATSLIVAEAGGVFRDGWGGTRFDTTTAVFTTPTLVDEVLGVLAGFRPPEPDEPRVARLTSTPIGTPAEQAVDPWRRFGLRPMPSMSARHHVTTAAPAILEVVDERAAELARPFVGVTTDGTVRAGFRPLGDGDRPKVDTRPVTEAALAFLAALSPAQREQAGFALDAVERRMWINVHMNHFRHGVMLEDLAPPVRELALGLPRAALSARGFGQARAIMRLNQLLADVTGDTEAFGEWPYFLSVFGTPGGEEPWAWQLDGHHLCLNALVLEDRMVLTPSFMGAEPRRVGLGPLAGTSLFDPEEQRGLDLIRSLSADQRARAVLHPSILNDDIPSLLQNPFDGRMQAGAFHDNLVAPYQGVPGADLSDAQRHRLEQLVGAYTGWQVDAQAAVSLTEVRAHLDETWFSWYGGTDDEAPFYYRVHSPVILVELDHHPGVAFDNEEPTRNHVHTVVRTPNGGDYGTDLLRQHHERFDHRSGRHEAR